jgi:Uma2 family endonuclease
VGAQRIRSLITVSEYEQIPNPPGGHYELHHGELVFVTYPVRRHKDLQHRLQKLLEPLLGPKGFIVYTEYPYRPLPENEVWGADIACVAAERHHAVEKWLEGSPELAIEVKSPSNTKAELHDRAMTTLAGLGSSEFWVVDDDAHTVTVYSRSGMAAYGGGESVPVPMAGGGLLVVDILQ